MTRIRRARMAHAARAGDLLDGLLHGWGLDERLKQYRALIVWDEVVGPQIAAHTRPEKIRDGILEVSVDQPVWMQQLQLLKPQLLNKLNARLGDSPLRDLFLKRGQVTPRTTTAAAATAPAWRRETLAPAEEAELATLLATVTDAELRRHLRELLVKQIKLTKAKNSAED
jgi:predicted nucleic acid-binding Zn ribbon protein